MSNFFGDLFNKAIHFFKVQDLAPVVESELLTVAANESEPTLERWLTPPSSAVKAGCAHSGADFDTAEKYFHDAAQRYANALEYTMTGKLPDDSPYAISESPTSPHSS